MTMNGRWGLLLALAGGVALGSFIAANRRSERRLAAKKERKQDLQAWEGEGGSLATAPISRVAVPAS